MRRFVLGVLLMSAAAAVFASEPLMVRVSLYQRVENTLAGDPAEPQKPGVLLPAPEGGWPASYEEVRQALTARLKGRFGVMLTDILPVKPLLAEQSTAFFIEDLGRPIELKADGDLLLPSGKHATIPVAPRSTSIFGAPDEQIYIAVTLLPAAEVRDDVVVLVHGEKPPRVLARVDPKYPSIEAMHNRSGVALAQIRIAPDGSVAGVNVLQKIQPQIDAAIVDALKQWRFEPPMHNGQPVVAYMLMSQVWRVE
jgi:TonB family protein